MTTPPPSIPETPPPGLQEFGESLALTGSQTWVLVAVGVTFIILGFIAITLTKKGT